MGPVQRLQLAARVSFRRGLSQRLGLRDVYRRHLAVEHLQPDPHRLNMLLGLAAGGCGRRCVSRLELRYL